MGKPKRQRKAKQDLKKLRRWKNTVEYLQNTDPSEHRRFYSRTIKYLLDESHWDSNIRDPHDDDHENIRQMLVAFSDQNAKRMTSRANQDVTLERTAISPLRRAKDLRGRRKNARRFTAEMMRLIRSHFPVELGEKDRARKMARFVRELIEKHLLKSSHHATGGKNEHT